MYTTTIAHAYFEYEFTVWFQIDMLADSTKKLIKRMQESKYIVHFGAVQKETNVVFQTYTGVCKHQSHDQCYEELNRILEGVKNIIAFHKYPIEQIVDRDVCWMNRMRHDYAFPAESALVQMHSP